MPTRPSLTQRFAIFDRTIAGMNRRLSRVRRKEGMMAALRWSRNELDRTFARTPAGVRATVACRAGCGACCHVPVDVQAHEVFFAAEHMQLNFSDDALTGALARLDAHRDRVAAFAEGARDSSRQACPLLSEGSCSIYDGRPQPCHTHHSSDADVCAEHLADPSVDLEKVYIPALRARMFAVMLGVDESLEAHVYDERSYDFGSALHEALTNSLCLPRWLRRQAAFPDSCLSDRFSES